MPWSNQSGGGNGGGWRPGSGGPWGQPPRGGGGGGGGGSQPPDLEELLRRGQDRLRRVFPGGGGSRGSGGLVVGLVLLGIIVLWLYQSFYVVQADEVGVELRFGEAKTTRNAAGEEVADLSGPGLHFLFWPFERVELVPALRENQENIGFIPGRTTTGTGAIMLTGDQNLVEVEFTVLWRIDDPVAYLFNVADQQNLVRMVAESAMREYVGRTQAEVFRTTGREQARSTVHGLIQVTLDNYRSGIVITALNIQRADPPAAVISAFEEVQRAQQDQERFQQEARVYANQLLGAAEGEAARVMLAADGYREQVIAEAEGQAQRFLSILAEYRAAPEVTLRRLYLETLETIYQTADLILVDPATGVTSYLPLTEIQNRLGAAR